MTYQELIDQIESFSHASTMRLEDKIATCRRAVHMIKKMAPTRELNKAEIRKAKSLCLCRADYAILGMERLPNLDAEVDIGAAMLGVWNLSTPHGFISLTSAGNVSRVDVHNAEVNQRLELEKVEGV